MPELSLPAPRRLTCARCLRPQSGCICRWIRPLENEVELLLLQHPLEQGQAKGTAGLLQLSLAHCRCECAEIFAPGLLQALLSGEGGKTPLLLYPATPGAPPAALPEGLAPSQLRLVVLDATWRKSRKMLALNPLLQNLPRLALHEMPASRYHIRKAHAPHQLSTLEAAACALAQLEQAPQKYAPLLAAFDGFVAQQAAFAGGGRTA